MCEICPEDRIRLWRNLAEQLSEREDVVQHCAVNISLLHHIRAFTQDYYLSNIWLMSDVNGKWCRFARAKFHLLLKEHFKNLQEETDVIII